MDEQLLIDFMEYLNDNYYVCSDTYHYFETDVPFTKSQIVNKFFQLKNSKFVKL